MLPCTVFDVNNFIQPIHGPGEIYTDSQGADVNYMGIMGLAEQKGVLGYKRTGCLDCIQLLSYAAQS